MDIKTLNWIRKNTKNKFQSDIWIAEFFNKQRNDKEYLKKVKANLKEDIKNFNTYSEIIGKEFLQKRKDELKYINYLIKKS